MSFTIDIQYASQCTDIPTENQLINWSETCLDRLIEEAEFSIRIVDEDEMIELNKTWRDIEKSTNVLSFPAGENPVLPELLGDIVLCAPVIHKEADEQGKAPEAHWAHMVIHGILHLLGYDHIKDSDAEKMENLEIRKLELLGYPNPYE